MTYKRVCDGCGVEITTGFLSVDIDFGSEDYDYDACSRKCMSVLLRRVADKFDPVDRTLVVVKSAGPYR